MTTLEGKRVLVSGGAGFLGTPVCARLKKLGAEVLVPRKSDFDLTQERQAFECLSQYKPEIVIHSAAYYGGLAITIAEPATIYYKNLLMGAHLMEASRIHGVKKFVSIGTACSYPDLDHPVSEDHLFRGPLHSTVEAYGSSKKMLWVQGEAYRRQFGFESIHLIPTNLYGPGDCFEEYRSHVAGALIKKFCEAHAKKEDVWVWGSGNPVREFLFVEDCADAVVLATAAYEGRSPLNVGTGVGTSIREFVETLCSILNFKGRVHWDASKPDGQAMKVLDSTKIKRELDWEPAYDLRRGLYRTIQWYQSSASSHASQQPSSP